MLGPSLKNLSLEWKCCPIMPGMSMNGKMGSVTSTPSHCAHVDSVAKVMWNVKGRSTKLGMCLCVLITPWPTRLNVRKGHDVIHPVLGRGHTNQNEASHNVLMKCEIFQSELSLQTVYSHSQAAVIYAAICVTQGRRHTWWWQWKVLLL